jgi:hypothetical protein
VLGLLNDVDPYGLSPGEEAPWDEYELEASPMVSILLNTGGITGGQVDDIWEKWFDERLSDVLGQREFDRFVSALNQLELPRA